MPKILVADDDRFTRLMLDHCLRSVGHHVLQAANGREAISIVESQLVDLVLMDMNMPHLDGWTAACHIHLQYQGRIPIIAVTAYSLPGDKARAAAAGCTRFIAKPIDVVQLLTTVGEALPI